MFRNRFNILRNEAGTSEGGGASSGSNNGEASQGEGGSGQSGASGDQNSGAQGGSGESSKGAETKANQGASGEAEIPEWFPKKYVKDGKPDHEALGKGYKELETKLGKGLGVDVPAKAEDYQLKPEKLPDGITWNDSSAKRASEVFHANGVSGPAAKAIMGLFLDLETENLAAAGTAYEKQLTADKTKLQTEWGGEEAYQKRVGDIQSLIVGPLGEDPGDAVLFSNPRILRFLGKVTDLLGEDAQAALRGGVAPGNTFADGAALAKKIMSDASHPDHAAYMAGDATVVKRVQRLIDGTEK